MVYGQKRPNLIKLLIDHIFEIEISYFVLLFLLIIVILASSVLT